MIETQESRSGEQYYLPRTLRYINIVNIVMVTNSTNPVLFTKTFRRTHLLVWNKCSWHRLLGWEKNGVQFLVESPNLAPDFPLQSRNLIFTSFQICAVPEELLRPKYTSLLPTHISVFFILNINISIGVTKDMLTLSQSQVPGQNFWQHSDLCSLKNLDRAWHECCYVGNSFSEQTETTPALSS